MNVKGDRMTTPDSQKVTNQELEQLHKTWCDLVGGQNTWLEHVFPFAMLRRTPVNLEDIYVVPRLVREKLRQNQEEIENGHERETTEKIMEEYLFKSKIEVTLKEALFNANHMVILGNPGGGKTLLLQYIALKASTNPGVLGINRLLPVFIPLREYNGKDMTLKEFIFHCIKDQICHMSEDVFEILLERNLFIFLFDGLHEVVPKSERVEVSRRIEIFMAVYPHTRMVLTSRPSGYKIASIEAIPHYTIAEFSDKEIEEFLEKWIAFQGKNGKFKNSGEKVQLISMTKEGIQELARNPHFLTILAFIHKKGKKFPVKKWEFYQYAVEIMIDIVETWKTHNRVIPHRDILIAVLEKVGFSLHSEELSYYDDEKLHMWLKEALNDIQGHSSKKEIDDIISILKEVGFLTEKKQGLYRVTHVAFQEFFAAQYLSKRNDIYNLITKKLYSSHWREVFLLSAAIAPPQQADMILDSILQAENDFEDYIHSNLLFAGEALAEQGRLNESKRNNIIQRLKGLINSGFGELRLEALQTLIKMGDVFDSRDIKELLSHEWYIRYLAVKYAMTRAGDTEMKKIIFALLDDKDWRVLREVIKYFTAIKATNTGIKEKIKELLKDNHSRIRKEGIRYFAQMGIKDAGVQKTIFALLRDESPDVCEEAVKYFTLLDGDIKIRRKFFELLKDDDSYVRYLALTYFTAIHGNSEIKKKFLELLKDDDSYVRYLALKYFTAKNIEIAENICDF
ncbi:MAG: NACHT domain-containing protein, partial [Theionarchaea archaeon]|nr:NACHT domain-containing protein [Theionarchaea archaeon]